MTGQRTNLPKWAQREFSTLEANLAYYKEKLERVHDGDTDVFIQNYNDGDQPLPPGTKIKFLTANGYIVVGFRESYLELHGSDSLHLLPRSSNTAYVVL